MVHIIYQLFKGDWALGIGHWALGIGHWALKRGREEKLTATAPLLPAPCSLIPSSPLVPNPLHIFRIFLLMGSKPLENRVLSS